MNVGSDNSRPEKLIHIIQGDYAVGDDDINVMTAILGSCVAACLCDRTAGVGGMNHFLLPEAGANSSAQVVYGAQSMELLINAMLKKGARKERIEAKIFGGARMIAGLSDVGASNGKFALQFLKNEGIPCLAESLGGINARRVRFWPQSGRAKQMLLGDAQKIAPVTPLPVAVAVDTSNDLELF